MWISFNNNLKEGVCVRKNNWLSYFVYAVILLGYIMLSNKILIYLNEQAQKFYNILPLTIWRIVIFIVLGLLLGLEKFLLEIRKEGKWEINLPKVIFLGIPTLYFSLSIFVYYCPIDFIRQPLSSFMETRMHFIPIFQMILGYILITSFNKVKE